MDRLEMEALKPTEASQLHCHTFYRREVEIFGFKDPFQNLTL